MVILGLGSNIGDRQAHLARACAALAGILREFRASRVIETPALLKPGAPAEWNQAFLNMAVCGETSLAPLALLSEIKRIERELGRVDRGHWAPREIDIDILAMDNVVLQMPELCIPHKELLNREFALLPLAELAPDWRWPLAGEYFGKTAQDIARAKNWMRA